MYHYYQVEGGEEAWKPVPAGLLAKVVEEKKPMFVSVLATDSIASKDTAREDKLALKYLGPMYFDLDSKTNIQDCIDDLQSLCRSLEKLELPLEQVRFFATGSKGFHVEIPIDVFVAGSTKSGVQYLPLVYKDIALSMAERSMDWRVYSMGMGRMWRQPNVQRPNGKYKVPLTVAQIEGLTPEMVDSLTSAPIPLPSYPEPESNLQLMILFDKALQDTQKKLKNAKKRKPVDSAVFKRPMPSMDLLMQGKGLKGAAGFNQIAMQLAVFAREAGIDEDTLIQKCEGLVTTHQSDGHRYHTPELRRSELRRMHQVVADDPRYEYAAPAIRSLLNHAAPDLDGVVVDRQDIEADVKAADEPITEEEAQVIAAAGPASETHVDEYKDVARGIDITRYGIYGETEFGKQRLSAVSFDSVRVLRTMESNKISCCEADILVNGKFQGRQVLEIENFHTSSNLNKFMSRYGHAFSGNEQQAKATYMRLIEKGRKGGMETYVHSREGLSLINIPHHPVPELQRPFLIWSDAKEVILEPRVRNSGILINFQGDPDPRGVFKCDLTDAPVLTEWLESEDNREVLRQLLTNVFSCQRPDYLGNVFGWLTACFYKAIFQKLYNQFPLLHVNGSAGSGKSSMLAAFARMFYYNQEPSILSPSSTVFALQQNATGSDSIPLIIDEYKPHEMKPGLHDTLLLMLRDSYNARDLQRGGGTRDNDNFRVLSSNKLSAPIVFIAEAIEEQSALMERVVLLTVTPPPPVVAHKWAARFHAFAPQSKNLAIIGRYLASKLVMKGYTVHDLEREFSPIYQAARNSLMLTEADLNANLDLSVLQEKQSARERTVFNFCVAKFGLYQFQGIIEDIFGKEEFKVYFDDFHKFSFVRMKDLAPATMPEFLKVMNVFVDLSYVDPILGHSIRYGHEYAFGSAGDQDTLELYARAAYSRYRQHCRADGKKPLYSGADSFVHSLKGVNSLISVGEGKAIQAPGGVHVFNLTELQRQGLMGFQVPSGKRKMK